MQPLLNKHFTSLQKLFSDHGIKNINMDDIAHRLHISKKTLYKEYACKDELVNDIYLNDYYQFRTSLHSLEQEKTDPISKTISMYNIVLEKIFSIKSYELFDLGKYYPALRSELSVSYRESIQQSVIGILSEGRSNNYFHDEIKPDTIADLFSFFFESYVLSRISEPKIGLTLCWNDVLDYHFRSICNPIGLNKWEILKTQT